MALIRTNGGGAAVRNVKYVVLGLGNASTSSAIALAKGKYKVIALDDSTLSGYASGSYYVHFKIASAAAAHAIGVSGATITNEGETVTDSRAFQDFDSVAPEIELSSDGNVTFSTVSSATYKMITVILIPA